MLMFVSEYVTSTHLVLNSPSDQGSPYLQLIHMNGRGYDAVLADLPCSASGVLRRHPDIKLLRRETDIMPLLAQQGRMLQALWTVVKPGGKMLFSTCSIFKEENEMQVARFLQQQTEASEVSLEGVEWGEPRPHGRQILSGRDNMDGFYYALLTKSANE